jgi:hypothetical protein
LESKAGIERVSILGHQDESSQALKIGMRRHFLDEPFPESAAPTLFQDVHVAKVGERGPIGHDSRKPNLSLTIEEREAKRVRDRALDQIQRDAFGPV